MYDNQILFFLLWTFHFIVIYLIITAPNNSLCGEGVECAKISPEMHFGVIVWIIGIQIMLFRLLLSLALM